MHDIPARGENHLENRRIARFPAAVSNLMRGAHARGVALPPGSRRVPDGLIAQCDRRPGMHLDGNRTTVTGDSWRTSRQTSQWQGIPSG